MRGYRERQQAKGEATNPPRSAKQSVDRTTISLSLQVCSRSRRSSECARVLRSFISVADVRLRDSASRRSAATDFSSLICTAQRPSSTVLAATPAHAPTVRLSASGSASKLDTSFPKISTYVIWSLHVAVCRREDDAVTHSITSAIARGTIPRRGSYPSSRRSVVADSTSGPCIVYVLPEPVWPYLHVSQKGRGRVSAVVAALPCGEVNMDAER